MKQGVKRISNVHREPEQAATQAIAAEMLSWS
jgi:hypothetical protein